MATLTVTVAEALTLDDEDVGTSRTFSYTDVDNLIKQTVLVDTAAQRVLFTFGTTAVGGGVIRTNFRYARIRNMDATNYVTLRLLVTGAETIYLRLDAGEIFLLTHSAIDVDAAAGAFGAFANLDSVAAQANTASVQLEVYVASA